MPNKFDGGPSSYQCPVDIKLLLDIGSHQLPNAVQAGYALVADITTAFNSRGVGQSRLSMALD